MLDYVCDCTVFTVVITKMKQEPFLISNKDFSMSTVEKSNIKYIVLFTGPVNSQLCGVMLLIGPCLLYIRKL